MSDNDIIYPKVQKYLNKQIILKTTKTPDLNPIEPIRKKI